MIVTSQFRPAFWLRGPHRQTLFAARCRPTPALTIDHESWHLPDGDVIDLAWLPDRAQPPDTPVVVVLHGLTGSIDSSYARGLLRQVRARGWRGLLMHFRGAGPRPNRLPQGYHSGDTADIGRLLRRLREDYPSAPLFAAGYSLGGNVLLKYLGEQGDAAPLNAAVAVSVPFDLDRCATAINRGLSRAYQAHLLTHMRAEIRRKADIVARALTLPDLDTLRDFRAFDDAVTAPLNGFADAADYYARCSSRPFLRYIRVPTLILHAADDPFMHPDVVPQAGELAPCVRLELSAHGGHVGFVAGDRFSRPRYWLEDRIPRFFDTAGASVRMRTTSHVSAPA